jgi:aminoglycoside phosphotransferase (APT) family kinase protein
MGRDERPRGGKGKALDARLPSGEEKASEELSAWVAGALGGEVTEWRLLTGGNSRTTYIGAVTVDGRPVPLVVRAERGDGPFGGSELSLDREARMYRAVADAGIATPRLLATSADAIAMTRITGEERWDEGVLDDVLAELAKLHRADISPALEAGFPASALADLELWAGIAAQKIDVESPYLDFALDFLRRRFPGEPERPVIVHGDVGVGNVMHDGERLTGLLDWEFSHLGDPLDDLAWITVRSVMFGVEAPAFGDRVRAVYADAAGGELDPARLIYWQAVVVLRNLATCLASISNPVRGRDRLVHYMLVPALQVMIVDAMCRIAGVEPAAPEPLEPVAGLPGLDAFGEIVAGLPLLVDAADDDYARTRGKRMNFLGRQLVENLPLAPAIAAADAGEGPPAASDEERLAQLSRMARRGLRLFPRQAWMAEREFASF